MSFTVNYRVLNKGWKRFTLMHMDRRVASVREDGTCTIYAPSFMPYSLYLEEGTDLDTRLNNLNNFYYWCAGRVLTLDRKYAKEILAAIGARQAVTDRDRAMIAISYHGLSLQDVYWIRFDREKKTFAELSLYRHSLSGAFVDVSLRGRALTAQNAELMRENDAAGDLGTPGTAPKAWIRENGTFYLLKDGLPRDVEAELLASRIVRCYRVESVLYELSEFEGQKVSKSRMITSEQKSIVPIEMVDVYCANHGLNREKLVREKDGYAYDMMNIVDYLVGNTDRHWGNWGFWIDNRTNQPVRLHPLMDFNKAFLAYEDLEGARCLTTRTPMSQREAARQGVKAVGLNRTGVIQREWFDDQERAQMFFRRLRELESLS